MTSAKQAFPLSVLTWLQDGYPQGIPPKDRIPLVALLHHELTAEQIKDVAVALAESRGEGEDPTVTRAEIGDLIEQITHEAPSDHDIARVRSVLAAAGWPLGDEP
ncbi:DUF3349 domain-containing protein [Rhodococcus oryzae]|uniref:DUF3349 domain-containing protein n=1 Tax=Rhodococcus oryzae TaxID=2571143 RepID=A0ABY2RN03_9NOCA|nr:DUF3349 domain-containing protein [Rhodococcus oryzae]TJZ79588.1 DUF3349 domain-containing protein [Rhodococcus oryzae]